MSYKAEVLFLLFGCLIFDITSAQRSQCLTPRGIIGTCINIRRCPPLLELLQTISQYPQNINYLRNSQCGFENSDPLVCCPYENGNPNPYPNPNPNPYPNPNSTPYPDRGNGNQGGSLNDPTVNSRFLPEECGHDLSNRIIGGVATELDEFPWMALLEYRKPSGTTTACGGVLISSRYVLTAAHCVTGRAIPRSWHLIAVRLGEYNTATDIDCISDGSDGQMCADAHVTVPVDKIIHHEDYNPQRSGESNDIALLRLGREVSFTNFIKPICLPLNGNLHDNFQVAGWGKTENKSESAVKLKVGVSISDKEACAKRYATYNIVLNEKQICAGGEAGKDSCRGDSGGPLMQQHRRNNGNRWTCVGVVSFGPTPCGMKDWPGVYTKVYNYMPWILSKLED